MKKVFLTLLLSVLLSSAVFAVPNLQVYIPGGNYNYNTGTWTTSSSSFEVWVIAANISTSRSIYNLNLVASTGPFSMLSGGALSVTPQGSATTSNSNFNFGYNPAMSPYSYQSMFPSWYSQTMVARRTSTNYSDLTRVYDMVNGGRGAMGQIFKFNVRTSLRHVRFNAYGTVRTWYGYRSIYNPLSHNSAAHVSQTPPGVPEPGTLLLFGMGLLGAGVVRKLRKK